MQLQEPTRPLPLHPPETHSELHSQATPKQAAPKQAVSKLDPKVVLATFSTIFLAEVGDKTQIATLMMSAQSQQPWVVFLGAAPALVLTSLLGVMAGQWLSKKFAPQVLDTLAGLSFLALAVALLWDGVLR
ncbi:TMEM165/GDT1 family protein [Leptolyngbya sp. FACHB-261]|uniref:TMEM165/GDT1 family protein n=1 Tax=Leptolyngbya sp. FACHB-261 TaxID=2692806 RepID=UPI00168A2415|nr:TMEM165/GDT1 family protein [Leptolyngbya sp. FACHB-261]MBD2104222.1 TMEM165/GDT1 family protein [Leptolyngbya sp. FACHB-261]